MDSGPPAAYWNTKYRPWIRPGYSGGAVAGEIPPKIKYIPATIGVVKNTGYTRSDTAAVNQEHGSVAAVNGGIAGGGRSVELMTEERKRGRPKKYDSEENLYTKSLPDAPPGFPLQTPPSGDNSPGSIQRHGNGKDIDCLGELFGSTAMEDFTPAVIVVYAGEDIAAKILTFAGQANRGVFVLSANGSVSIVTLCKPGSCGTGLLTTFEGCFEILTLRGSYSFSDTRGIKSWSGGLCVSLASPDGHLIGGTVAGLLMAANPIQVVVGSFVQHSCNANITKHQDGPNSSATCSPGYGEISSAKIATTNG